MLMQMGYLEQGEKTNLPSEMEGSFRTGAFTILKQVAG